MEERRYSSWMLERIAIGDTVRLRLGSSTIGRHSSSVIRILDSTYVSRFHAVIEVSKDNRSVSLKDVSSNGIFVNDVKYEKVTVQLNNGDLIGIGVTTSEYDNALDVLKLPIYELKYAPIRPIRIPNANRPNGSVPTAKPVPSTSKSPPPLPGESTDKKYAEDQRQIEIDNNSKEEDMKPCCSKNIKVEKLTVSEEIFEISDDDDRDVVEKPKEQKMDIITQTNPNESDKMSSIKQQDLPYKIDILKEISNTNEIKQNETGKRTPPDVTTLRKEKVSERKSPDKQQEMYKDLTKQIEMIIKNESNDDKDYINPSQKTQEKTSNEVINNNVNDAKETLTDKVLKSNDQHEEKTQNNEKSAPAATENNKERKETLLHVPIISNLKKERIRSVSADIENIFGDIDGHDVLQEKIKEISPLIYKEIHVTKNLKPINGDGQHKMLTNGDLVVLTDDEDLEVEELGTIVPNVAESKDQEEKKSNTTFETAKSPNVFDSSLDNSKEEDEGDKNAENIIKPIDNIDLEEYTKYAPNSDDEDIEDLMFSQVLINDMKAELQDDLDNEDNLPLPNAMGDNAVATNNDAGAILAIKQEPGLEVFSAVPKELENSCWIISDDEDYDEELETKVNDWSNKIFSQSFSLMSQNMSQVYDIDEIDNNAEEDYNDDANDDISLLEDDIEGIANMYNNTTIDNEEAEVDLKLKTLNDELKKAKEQAFEALKQKNEEDIAEKLPKTDDNIEKKQDIKLKKDEKDKDILESNKEKSPDREITDGNNLTESPLIRIRRLSKTNPVIQSPSSSEDEFELESNKLNNNTIKISETEKPVVRLPPPVIEAPSLPKHKGKLRGVSAEVPKKPLPNSKYSSVQKAMSSIKEKIHQERLTNDLKRKWLEKPSVAKRRDKEHKKFIKECRKDKLKELAERKKSPSKVNQKRKLSTEDHEHKAKVAKVKVTTHNRGAFLVNNDPTPPPPAHGHKPEPINQFKIPKVPKKTEEPKKPQTVESNKHNSLTRSLSVDGFETFSQQLAMPDILLFKRQNSDSKKCDKPPVASNKTHNPPPPRRHSTNEPPKRPPQTNDNRRATPPSLTSPICKEAIAARAVRTTNKITFASMEKNIVESEENKRKLCALSSNNTSATNTAIATTSTTSLPPNNSVTQPSNLKKSPASCHKKKTVRFNDTPVIHYIERITGACKKINNKDIMPMTTYKDRRHLIRTVYPIIDHTDTIISKILSWSNEWLIKRNAAADAAGDVIYPMPTHFTSFEQYKSIIFPLMKLEFVSTLEREYNFTQKVKNFKVSLEYATHNSDRIMLVTKLLNTQNKELNDSSLYDLVLLEPDQKGPQIFAYVVANRKGAGTFITIVYEIIAKNFTLEYFKAIKEFHVRPVMDKVRVHFGAFNAVYQLQSTPLFQKLVNPLELLKCRPPPKKKVQYRGFDQLNDKQRQVLLNTYMKIIDETTPNVTLIQGPPGTGKSCVITNLALQTLYGEEVRYLDKKILICAQSNAAVDVIAGKLYDISMRMRPEKRFRLIRYGMLNKMHPSVMPIALQKVVEHDQLKKLQAKNKNIQLENKENLKNQILQFEAQVAEMSMRNIKGTVEEDVLIEKKRQLQLMRNILNESMRPEDERSLFTWYLSNANIVCATLSSCVNLSQFINFFDICIIDEATQCTEPWTLLPLKFGINSLVLVGDTQQLPATVLSKKANELGLGTSMFTRIQQCLDNIPSASAKVANQPVTTPNNIICSLQTQYRMHPEICRWPNQYFYRNELINGKSTIDFTKTPLVPFSILNLAYTQHNSSSNGKITNNLEAEFVAKLLKALDGFIPNKYNSYGVITPYAHHRATLESSIRALGLTNIMVNTIDSYQGLEKDVIVISNARTHGIGFLSNPQRLNVALTRSKKCLILCGSFKNLETVPAWRCLLESARERKLYHEISANCIADIQTNVIDKIKLKNQNN
ncbi:uncharacterized protein LOC111676883 [Lucilia cuprina]|uniref:uncharacterized protein LOC111676883 n=1 Tax=Lucilia cuprina TaxID=7375 RepID=UPI001F05E51A|nr:uncharacterized protein LOC111676883 [Lucilia cuprina]